MVYSLGNLIDQLTVANLRIWSMESIKRKAEATDTEIANATRVTNIENKRRNDLIQSIDEQINFMVQTGELQTLYNQGSNKTY